MIEGIRSEEEIIREHEIIKKHEENQREEKEKLDRYINYIESYFKKPVFFGSPGQDDLITPPNETILSSGPERFSVASKAIFENSSYLRIFSKDLSLGLGQNKFAIETYLKGLRQFFLNGKKNSLEILVNEDYSKENDFNILSSLENFYGIKKRADIKKTEITLINQEISSSPRVYFTLGNDNMYLIKPDENKDRYMGNFHDRQYSLGLGKKFDELFKEAKIISLD